MQQVVGDPLHRMVGVSSGSMAGVSPGSMAGVRSGSMAGLGSVCIQFTEYDLWVSVPLGVLVHIVVSGGILIL